MPRDSIQVKWNSVDSADYEATIAALQGYEETPTITSAIRLKGKISPEGIKQIIKVAQDHGAEIGVTLKAEWEPDSSRQLRLFPPSYGADTVADIEGWLNA